MARVLSCAIVGLDGALIEVEVDIAPGLPSFTIVGLPDAAVQEAKDRVRAAIRNTGYQFPMKRITANLAPADLKKVGPSYDLPIAIGILAATGQIPDSWRPAARPAGMVAPNGAAAVAAAPVHAAAALPAKQEAPAAGETAAAPPVTEALQDAAVVAELEALLGSLAPDADEREESLLDTAMFLGELALDGALRHTDGMLPMVGAAREHGIPVVFVPAVDGAEAALVEGIEVLPAANLGEVVRHLTGEAQIAAQAAPDRSTQHAASDYRHDLRDVKGQEHAKRALEVAAAGGHNVLFVGPPGAGKTLLARCLPSILPPLQPDESLELSKVYSVCGLLPAEQPLVQQRPFRAPHHTTSYAGLLGGGRWPRPGEVSLAHRGVLFLDELLEFNPAILQMLRQPLEDRTITVSRVAGSATFPAALMLAAAMNPCPCGWLGDQAQPCRCSPSQIARYQRRLSGPLLDRIDLSVEVPRVDYDKLTGLTEPEPSAAVRDRVSAARERQQRRFAQAQSDKAPVPQKRTPETPGEPSANGSAGNGRPVRRSGRDTRPPAAGAGRQRLTCNADLGPRGVQEHCQAACSDDALALLRTAMQQLQVSARGYHRILKVARTVADLAGSEAIGTEHVAEALQYRPRLLSG